jgi:HEAT repeat protein
VRVEGRWVIALDAAGWPETLEATESLDIAMPELGATVRSAAKLLLRAVATPPGVALGQPLGDRWERLDTSPVAAVEGADEAARDMERDFVDGATLGELTAQLESGPASEAMFTMARIESLVRIEPETARQIADYVLSSPERTEDAALALIGALGGAEVPAARDALTELGWSDALEPGLRMAALTELGLGETTDAETASALLALVGDPEPDVAASAALAAGSAARTLSEAGQQEAADVVDQLIHQLEQASTVPEIELYLGALGNTRDGRALPAIAPYAGHVMDPVRQAAAEALRFMPAPTADGLLHAMLQNDPSPEVRSSAIFAAAHRPLAGYIQLLSTLVVLDPIAGVRAEAIGVVGPLAAEVPAVATALQKAADADPDPAVRESALAFLTGAYAELQP